MRTPRNEHDASLSLNYSEHQKRTRLKRTKLRSASRSRRAPSSTRTFLLFNLLRFVCSFVSRIALYLRYITKLSGDLFRDLKRKKTLPDLWAVAPSVTEVLTQALVGLPPRSSLFRFSGHGLIHRPVVRTLLRRPLDLLRLDPFVHVSLRDPQAGRPDQSASG